MQWGTTDEGLSEGLINGLSQGKDAIAKLQMQSKGYMLNTWYNMLYFHLETSMLSEKVFSDLALFFTSQNYDLDADWFFFFLFNLFKKNILWIFSIWRIHVKMNDGSAVRSWRREQTTIIFNLVIILFCYYRHPWFLLIL